MGLLQELWIETFAAKSVERWGAELVDDDLAKLASEIAPEFSRIAAGVLADRVKKDARRGLKRYQRQRKTFEEKLGKQWAKPLHLLELIVELAEEVGNEVIEHSSPDEDRGNVRNHTFDALVGIHARGCQMSPGDFGTVALGFR